MPQGLDFWQERTSNEEEGCVRAPWSPAIAFLKNKWTNLFGLIAAAAVRNVH